MESSQNKALTETGSFLLLKTNLIGFSPNQDSVLKEKRKRKRYTFEKLPYITRN